MEEYKNLKEIFKVEGTKATFPKGLIDSAQLANIFSSENEVNRVVLRLRPGELRITGIGQSGKHSEIRGLKYEGEEIEFSIDPKILSEMIKTHNEIELTENVIKIKSGNYTYVTFLFKTEGKKND